MEEDYKLELDFLSKKIPTIAVTWQVRVLIEAVMTPLMPKEEADRIYSKLRETFKIHVNRVFKLAASKKLDELVKQTCSDPSKGLYRIAISMKLFKEVFANELMGWGGGGGKGLKQTNYNPLKTTLGRR